MKYNINLIRGCTRLTTIFVATVALAATSFGAIYETPDKFEPRRADEGKQYESGSVYLKWVGAEVTHSGWFDRQANGGQLFCVLETFYFNDHHAMSGPELARFLAPYSSTFSERSFDGVNTYWFIIGSNGGNYALAIYRNASNSLSVMTMRQWEQVFKDWAIARVAAYNSGSAETPEAARIQPRGTPNDCLIIATEAFSRLSNTAHWAKIVAFSSIMKDGRSIGGHAICVYQPTANSNVFLYDEDGSADLHSQSHDLAVITAGFNRTLKTNYNATGARWLDDAGNASSSTAQTADNSSADRGLQPAREIEKTATAAVRSTSAVKKPTEQSLPYLIGYCGTLGIIGALYIWVIVICFDKGKPKFGTLGIIGLLFGGLSWFAIIGACRLAKPHSTWARRRYGPEKMRLALERFADLYKPETRRAIEQSIEAVDISQRVRA
jgi:hypothetical protein